jgi:YfiH family protein
MIRCNSNPTIYYQFETLIRQEIQHGVFTRQGGVSPDPWASLNMSISNGDEWARVARNRELAFSALGYSPESRFDVWQVHSARVVLTDAPRGDLPMQKADAIITDKPGVVLFMRYADCVPILLYDPRRRAIGLVHAGWLGTLRKVTSKTVQAMESAFGSDPSDLIACIGPSIGVDHYPVGPEVAGRVREVFGSNAHQHLSYQNGQAHFDLWSANERLLNFRGVRSIENSRLCTACCVEDWFSHRGEGGKTGRFGVILALAG